MVYQNGVDPSLIVLRLNQRIYPKPLAQVRTNQCACSESIQTRPFATMRNSRPEKHGHGFVAVIQNTNLLKPKPLMKPHRTRVWRHQVHLSGDRYAAFLCKSSDPAVESRAHTFVSAGGQHGDPINVNERVVSLVEPRIVEAVSYTHLTLPTTR